MIALILALAFAIAAIGRRHGGGADPLPVPVRPLRRRHEDR